MFLEPLVLFGRHLVVEEVISFPSPGYLLRIAPRFSQDFQLLVLHISIILS